jgi:hypothetical protein
MKIDSAKDFWKFIAAFMAAGVAWLVLSYRAIRRIVGYRSRMLGVLVALCMITGCASLTYQAPDGTIITYTRFMTGADTIKGQAGAARIEAQGQNAVDPEVLQAVIKIMGAVK